jgi:ubiquinone/menaquinone biosynthesis C-methylase UbiE
MESMKMLVRAGTRSVSSFWRRERAEGGASHPCPASRAGLLKTPLAQAHANRVMRHLDVREGMRLLDAGCGVGRLSIPLARLAGEPGEVVALDVQEEMLAELRRAAEAEGLGNITTVRGAAGATPLPGPFDRALLSSVLGEIPVEQRVRSLQQIHRALKPGGLLYICEVALFDPDYQSAEDVRALAWDAGFALQATHRVLPGYVMALVKDAR